MSEISGKTIELVKTWQTSLRDKRKAYASYVRVLSETAGDETSPRVQEASRLREEANAHALACRTALVTHLLHGS
jgi:hypothetical protein